MTTKAKMSNAIARRYFLHDEDSACLDSGGRRRYPTDNRVVDEVKCCFFANDAEDDNWGFWVRPDGTIDIDDATSNGELPHCEIVGACVRSAVKHLNR